MLGLARYVVHGAGGGGNAPSLNFNFVDGSAFSPQITFTRASSATYFDATGTLQTATTDAPRFDYDPSTLAAQGLLIEESRTNLKTYSENIALGFIQQNTTVTADAATAPDGATTADLSVPNTVSATHASFSSGIAFATSSAYTYSFFAKPSGYSTLQLTFTSAFNNTNIWANFILVGAGSIGFKGTGATASIQQCANGWYRCVLTGTSGAAATTGGCVVIVLDSDRNARDPAFSGNNTSGAYIWGAQLEADEFPTSYIPTTSTAVTRAADVASVNTLSPWYNADEGTIYSESVISRVAGTSLTGIFKLDDGTNSNTMRSFYRGSGSSGVQVITSGSTQADLTPTGALTANQNLKLAFAYKVDDFAASGNGGAVVTDSGGTVPTVNRLTLGVISAYLNGYLRRITYYPRRLSNAQLQQITA